jgi:hypothetical protein
MGAIALRGRRAQGARQDPGLSDAEDAWFVSASSSWV